MILHRLASKHETARHQHLCAPLDFPLHYSLCNYPTEAEGLYFEFLSLGRLSLQTARKGWQEAGPGREKPLQGQATACFSFPPPFKPALSLRSHQVFIHSGTGRLVSQNNARAALRKAHKEQYFDM